MRAYCIKEMKLPHGGGFDNFGDVLRENLYRKHQEYYSECGTHGYRKTAHLFREDGGYEMPINRANMV